MKFLFNYIIFNDAPEPWQILFQDSATKTMEGIEQLHDEILYYLTITLIVIVWITSSILYKFSFNQIRYKYQNHGTIIELIWTCLPAFILIAIAFPSFKLLYLMDEIIDPEITIKAIGKQWFWNYEYSDYINTDNNSIEFESYMIPTDELESGTFRLLEVDNRVIVPVDTHIRFIISASDVIHSFSVSSLGIKMDAIPGL
jgi:cytochrome c oxidase subunit 2